MSLVLDASVALAWCFEDEQTPAVMDLLDRIAETGGTITLDGDTADRELAQRRRLPLASLDQDLRKAASASGVDILGVASE